MTRAGPGSFLWGALAPDALGHSGEDHWQSSLENLWTHLWRMPGLGPGRVTWCQIPQYNSWVGLGKLQEPCGRSAVLCSVTSNSFATPWSVACQAPLSMGFSGQECCRLPFPPPGDLPDPGIELSSLVSPALAGRFFYYWATWTATGEETDVQTFTRQDSHPVAKPRIKPPVLTLNPPIHPYKGWGSPITKEPSLLDSDCSADEWGSDALIFSLVDLREDFHPSQKNWEILSIEWIWEQRSFVENSQNIKQFLKWKVKYLWYLVRSVWRKRKCFQECRCWIWEKPVS